MSKTIEIMAGSLEKLDDLADIGKLVACLVIEDYKGTDKYAIMAAQMVELIQSKGKPLDHYWKKPSDVTAFIQEQTRLEMGDDFPVSQIDRVDENGQPLKRDGKVLKKQNPQYTRIVTICNSISAQYCTQAGLEVYPDPNRVWEPPNADKFFKNHSVKMADFQKLYTWVEELSNLCSDRAKFLIEDQKRIDALVEAEVQKRLEAAGK